MLKKPLKVRLALMFLKYRKYIIPAVILIVAAVVYFTVLK